MVIRVEQGKSLPLRKRGEEGSVCHSLAPPSRTVARMVAHRAQEGMDVSRSALVGYRGQHTSARQLHRIVRLAAGRAGSELERYDLRGSQASGVSQAQERLVLDVRGRREQPTDLFRAQYNGQAARLAGRYDLFGKIGTLQRDPEEEPQRRGSGVDRPYRRSNRRQPHLIATDILRGRLLGGPAYEIGKLFDVADILLLRLGMQPADRHVFDQSPA